MSKEEEINFEETSSNQVNQVDELSNSIYI